MNKYNDYKEKILAGEITRKEINRIEPPANSEDWGPWNKLRILKNDYDLQRISKLEEVVEAIDNRVETYMGNHIKHLEDDYKKVKNSIKMIHDFLENNEDWRNLNSP